MPLTVRTTGERGGGGGGGARGKISRRGGGIKSLLAREHSNANTSSADGRSNKAEAELAGTVQHLKRREAYRNFPARFDVRCKVEGCIIACDKPYSARNKVCTVHAKMAQLDVDGIVSRFCHKCHAFHSLSAFESEGHTCAAWLTRLREEYHEQGKRKKRKTSISLRADKEVSTGGTDDAAGGSHLNAAASSDDVATTINVSAKSDDSTRASADDSVWARVSEMTATVFSERSNSYTTLDHHENDMLLGSSSQQLGGPKCESDFDLIGDGFHHVLDNFKVIEEHLPQHQHHPGPAAIDDALLVEILQPRPGQRSALERPLASPSHGTAACDLQRKQSLLLLSFWIKLHGFTPAHLPPGGLRDMLAHWMQSRPTAVSSSAQPGCTLLKFDFLLPEDAVSRVRARGVLGLAAMVGDGSLGARGDFDVGFDGDVAEAKETHREGSKAFEISMLSTNAEDERTSNDPVSIALLASEFQVVSNPCVCSSGEEGDTTVIVRLPYRLPEGGRVECRARGRIVPVTISEMRDGPDGDVTAYIDIPPTNFDGVALLEMVNRDGTASGVPAAVLILATDALLAATINAVGSCLFYVDLCVRNPLVSALLTFRARILAGCSLHF